MQHLHSVERHQQVGGQRSYEPQTAMVDTFQERTAAAAFSFLAVCVGVGVGVGIAVAAVHGRELLLRARERAVHARVTGIAGAR